MSFKHIDIEGALRRLADRRIDDAMAEGKFDNLSGAGQPLNLDPIPADENARLMWWALHIMKSNDFTPDEIRWRKTIETLKGELAQTTHEPRIRILCSQINELVHKLNTLGTNMISSTIASMDVEAEVLRARNSK